MYIKQCVCFFLFWHTVYGLTTVDQTVSRLQKSDWEIKTHGCNSYWQWIIVWVCESQKARASIKEIRLLSLSGDKYLISLLSASWALGGYLLYYRMLDSHCFPPTKHSSVLVTLHSAHLGNNILFTVCQLNHESFLSGRKWVMLKVYVVPFIKVLLCNHFSSFSIVLQSILSYFQRRVVHSTETETFIMLCFLLPSTWGISWLFP